VIGVVDYGAGNLRNVQAALGRLQARWRLVASPDDLNDLGGLILPGVGQFGTAARRLKKAGLFDPLRAFVGSGRPFLGICLGMQLLFEASEEDPHEAGLGALRGRVLKLGAARLPHIGWAVVEPRAPAAGAMFENLDGKGFFAYFAHSFAVEPTAPAAAALTSCPPAFASAVRDGNVWGVQFHPEKSGADGHRLLANFVAATISTERGTGGGG
jgi:imidazole glycerol phosphate synthase glutamine amidotransferase subunit